MLESIERIDKLLTDQGKDLDRIARDMREVEESLLAVMQRQRQLYLAVVKAAQELRDGRWLCSTGVNHLRGADNACPGCKMIMALRDLEHQGLSA